METSGKYSWCSKTISLKPRALKPRRRAVRQHRSESRIRQPLTKRVVAETTVDRVNMKCENITITDASAADFAEILNLLARVQLPPEGVAENVDGFLVAKDDSSRVIATIGLERHGNTGLLRS